VSEDDGKCFYMFRRDTDEGEYYLVDEEEPLELEGGVRVHHQKIDYRYVGALRNDVGSKWPFEAEAQDSNS
jgi:hypothetical protein